MASPMAIGALTTQGLRSEFSMVYQPRYQGLIQRIGDIIWLDATSDKLQEVYGFLESPIYPVRWEPGNVISSKTILSQQFTIVNRDFGRRVYLPKNWQDDQTGSAWQVARSLGANWGTLAERIFYQYILNSTDPDLLPVVPNSADGSALYLTTTRFGDAGGNVVGQTGVTTVQDVITDLFSVHERYQDFQNTESQPFWDPIDTQNIAVFYGTNLNLVMQQAKNQTRPHSVVSTTGAATTNLVLEGDVSFTFTASQRITNNNYFCFLRGLPSYMRPIVRQVRKGETEAQGNFATSDHTRDTGEPYVQFDSREGWGSALAIATIRGS